ncbi:Mut7-C ubiquitin/RNAse domain-containing protein [Mycolicibacterium fortuitum]|uniref:Mut7-C ubiquitin/RNAse domain-containing protein n=1 Tax=Mycolicibacterium fortuitum TaxID=1766 RepID=UPI001AEFF033|nr:Mut7-C ubiquitin/RNAse domain-containing protein [Mycolicibacterium fortuitum]MBP3083685.1 Mut7-C ubiquitin/RNAse domain-containing protein [Mycolicibacterium fortuitum]
MAGFVTVRAYAELNDFLEADSRGRAVRRPVQSHQTVKDVLEATGIPHTEIDLILVNGDPVSFEHRPAVGDRIAVYPMFEALDIGATARLRPEPLRHPRFVVDVNLGRLARLLRVLGFDVWWSSAADDQTLADISLDQQRILLTRDRGLLKRRTITHGLFVHSQHPEEQTLEVLRRLDLRRRIKPFTRCVRCNGQLAPVAKEQVIDQLEPLTRRYYDEFSQCPECGRIYWAGSHFDKLSRLVDRLLERL